MPPETNVPTPATPTPDGGIGLSQARDQIAGLLDDDGQYNPRKTKSRAHPDKAGEAAEDVTTERDTKGRFQKKTPEPDSDAPEVEQDEVVPDEAPDEDTEQGDTDEAPEDSADPSADTDTAETAELTTMAEFAAALDMSLDDFKNALKHSFNAAGEELTVTLAELEKGYQRDADYRRSTAKLADERRSFELARQNTHDSYVRANHVAAQVIAAAEQDIIQALNDPQLQVMRENDPGAWSARRTELGEQIGRVRHFQQQAAAAYDQFVATEHGKAKQRESEALLKAVPGFGASHTNAAREVLQTVGLSAEEVNAVLDHRMIVAALELGNLRTENAALKAEKEKARASVSRIKKEVPKMQKPGVLSKPKSKATINKEKVAKLQSRAKKTGHVRDAAKVIEQFL